MTARTPPTPTPSATATAKTFLEFFAGIGLVHEGLRPSGWTCAYANDLDPNKQRLYDNHVRAMPPSSRAAAAPHDWHLGDVWETDEVTQRINHACGDDAPFLATASFPCTDMSLAGKLQGFTGKESSAFFGFSRALRQLEHRKPSVVLLENVAGLLTSRNGQDFRAVAEELSELGYTLDCWQLDAKHFVPQSRVRLFIAGWLPHVQPPLLSGVSDSAGPSSLRPPRLLDAVNKAPVHTAWQWTALPEPPTRTQLLSQLVDQDARQDWWDEAQTQRHWDMLSDAHRERIEQWIETGQPRVATAFRRIRQKQQRLEVRFDGIAGCLRTPKGGSARQIVVAYNATDGVRMRWMSPREYARLQGAGDFHWSADEPSSRVLFGFGDAVCVPAIRWIDQHLLTPAWRSVTHSNTSTNSSTNSSI